MKAGVAHVIDDLRGGKCIKAMIKLPVAPDPDLAESGSEYAVWGLKLKLFFTQQLTSAHTTFPKMSYFACRVVDISVGLS